MTIFAPEQTPLEPPVGEHVLHPSGRRARHSSMRRGRHRGDEHGPKFSRGFAALAELALGGVQVSAHATELATGEVLFSVDDHVVMPTASIGKVLLLVEVAARLAANPDEQWTMLARTPDDMVNQSGIWQHMVAASLPIGDLAALVASTNDNVATNVLLRYVGIDAVSRRTEELGLKRTALLDLVRDFRGPDDAPQLSVGSARELTWLMSRLAKGQVVSRDASRLVIAWLALGSDLSMVASAFGLNPLAHRARDHGMILVNMTGTDAGVRSDVGVLRGPRAGVSYAVSTYFDDASLADRLRVLEAMRTIGHELLDYTN